MEQTAITIGNSVGVVIPQPIRTKIGLNSGDKVFVETKGEQIVLTKSKKRIAGEVDVKFMKMLDEFINDHEDALRELSKR